MSNKTGVCVPRSRLKTELEEATTCSNAYATEDAEGFEENQSHEIGEEKRIWSDHRWQKRIYFRTKDREEDKKTPATATSREIYHARTKSQPNAGLLVVPHLNTSVVVPQILGRILR